MPRNTAEERTRSASGRNKPVGSPGESTNPGGIPPSATLEGDRFNLDEVMEAEVQLLGRATYDEFAKAWPSREGEFADKLNSDPSTSCR